MKKKTILLIVLVILLMVSMINFITGTTITVNGKQVTSLSGHLAAYFGLIILVYDAIIITGNCLGWDCFYCLQVGKEKETIGEDFR